MQDLNRLVEEQKSLAGRVSLTDGFKRLAHLYSRREKNKHEDHRAAGCPEEREDKARGHSGNP